MRRSELEEFAFIPIRAKQHLRVIIEIHVFPGGIGIFIKENFAMSFSVHVTLNRQNILKWSLVAPETDVKNTDFLV